MLKAGRRKGGKAVLGRMPAFRTRKAVGRDGKIYDIVSPVEHAL